MPQEKKTRATTGGLKMTPSTVVAFPFDLSLFVNYLGKRYNASMRQIPHSSTGGARQDKRGRGTWCMYYRCVS
eukprot:scaffold1581_cov169-Amphora_coffeaeformis.AAC.7